MSSVRADKSTEARHDFLLALRVRGPVKTPREIEYTLTSLRLTRKFTAVILKRQSSIEGMLKRVKDMITWGQPAPRTLVTMFAKRGRAVGDERISEEFLKSKLAIGSIGKLVDDLLKGKIELDSLWDRGIKPSFRLKPPKGGFKKSTKRPFGDGGELGYRHSGIDELIMRMI